MTMDGRRVVIAVLVVIWVAVVMSASIFVNVIGPRPAAAKLMEPPKPAGLVALTFDDGPSTERTPYVLDVLKAKGIKATFFLQGSHAERYPDLVRRIRDEGHVIGNHSYSHPHFRDLSPQQAEDEIVRTNRILEQITGTKPVLFRYPFGEASGAGDAVIRREDMWGGVLWHWDSSLQGDFECPGMAGVEKYFVTESIDQAVILLHDASDVLTCPAEQWDYLPRAIDATRAKGLDFGVVAPAVKGSPVNQGSWVKVVRP
jgi:peptidoglycan/xylan/chitin deacetylase (PgdA/CDA1 family)